MRFFGKQFESIGEKFRTWRTTRNLSPMHVIERLITVHNEDSDKLTVFGEFLLIALSYRVSKNKVYMFNEP